MIKHAADSKGSVQPCLEMTRMKKVKPPHVPYTVTELAAVVSLRRWTNLRVKAVGILCSVDGVKKTVALHEVGIPHNPVSILVSRTVFQFSHSM